MRWPILLAPVLAGAGGCDRLLQLTAVPLPADAAGSGDGNDHGDAPPDVPPASLCPSSGAPLFGTTRRAVIIGCNHYSEGTSGWSNTPLAIAQCGGSIMAVAGGTTIAQTGITGTFPSQSGDGELFANASGAINSYLSSTTTPNKWISDGAQSIPLVLGAADFVTAPTGSRGDPDRRIVAFRQGSPWTMDELDAAGANNWSLIGALDVMASPSGSGSLSHDGLRLVIPTATGVMYSSRPNITMSFRPALMIFASTTVTSTPYLTEDCSRLYFTNASGDVDYVE